MPHNDNAIPLTPGHLVNLEAEAALLGALLSEPALVPGAVGRLRAEDFHEPVHQRIFAAIAGLHAQGLPPSPLLLKPRFDTDEGMQALGGAGYLMKLAAIDEGLLAAGEIIRQLADLARRRRLRALAGEMARRCDDLNIAADEALLAAAEGFEREREQAPARADVFELFDAEALEALEPPRWLIHQRIAEDGLTILYGEPGAGKSFIALDMGLRVALGMDWHGERTCRTGVLYIAGEGARGIGKRITGWRLRHGLESIAESFLVLPVAVQLLEPAEVSRLLRTIDAARRQAGFPFGLVIVDTVSRAIVGSDENTQETMTRFVAACDAIKRHIGGAVVGIHHSGKDRDRGMRGSSVLLAACDGALRAEKAEGAVTLRTEKQKDAEESAPVRFELERYAWYAGSADAPGEALTTLVPVRPTFPAGLGSLPRERIAQAFGMMADAWAARKPLSSKPQTRRDGRYAPAVFAARIGGDARAWEAHLQSWLDSGCLAYELADRNTKLAGLRVISPIV